MSESDWTTHIVAGAAWRRFGIMLLLIPILGCVGFFIAFTALFQFLSVLANGETSPNLRSSGEDLGRYAAAIIDFLTYNSERRPFPFAARADNESRPPAATKTPRPRHAPATARKPATRKTSQRKRTTRKKTSRRKTSTAKKTGAAATRQTTTPPDKTSD